MTGFGSPASVLPSSRAASATALNGADRRRLRDAGYCVVENVLSDAMLQQLRTWSATCLDQQASDHFEQFRNHGSMIALDFRDPTAERLITWPGTVAALARLGFADAKWLSGYLISKPPSSPALWWHQDWWAWEEPESFREAPPQLFAMYYLRDVGEDDGCLRVIPGSHRRPHPLHVELPPAHGRELADAQRAERALGRQPDEVSVPVRAGDVVFGDVRLLHATHPNRSSRRRTCLTVWYLPTYRELSPSLRAYLALHPSQPSARSWQQGEVSERLAPLVGVYDGDADPVAYNRTPPPDWASGSPG